MKKLRVLHSAAVAAMILITFSFVEGAKASPYGFTKRNLRAVFETSYFNSTKNYDAGGNTVALPSGNSVTEYRLNMLGAYDLSEAWGFYVIASMKNNQSVGSPLTRTNTGPGDATLGTDFLLWHGFINLIPDVSITVPTYSQPGTDDAALLGDGATAFTGKLHISKVMGSWGFASYIGYRYRDRGYSTQIPWSIGLHKDFARFFIDGGALGYTSLTDDKYTNNSFNRSLISDRVNAGSLLYNAVNPSVAFANLRVGYRISRRFFLALGVDQPFWGQNSAIGTRYALTLGFSNILGTASTARNSGRFEEEQHFDIERVENFDVEVGPEDGVFKEEANPVKKKPAERIPKKTTEKSEDSP